jgi:hypothetical protein
VANQAAAVPVGAVVGAAGGGAEEAGGAVPHPDSLGGEAAYLKGACGKPRRLLASRPN